MVVARIFCPFKLNIKKMMEMLQFLWVLAYQPIATLVSGSTEANKFTIELQSRADVQRAIKYSPTKYVAWLLVLKPYQFGIPPSMIHMTLVNFWVSFMNLPVEFFGEGIPEMIANNIGTFINKELPQDCNHARPFIRCLVQMDLNERFDPTFDLILGEHDVFEVMLYYEPLPKSFCKICRIINHPTEKCRELSNDDFPIILLEPDQQEEVALNDANVQMNFDELEDETSLSAHQAPQRVYEARDLIIPEFISPPNLVAPAIPPGFSMNISDADLRNAFISPQMSIASLSSSNSSKRLWEDDIEISANKFQRWDTPIEESDV